MDDLGGLDKAIEVWVKRFGLTVCEKYSGCPPDFGCPELSTLCLLSWLCLRDDICRALGTEIRYSWFCKGGRRSEDRLIVALSIGAEG